MTRAQRTRPSCLITALQDSSIQNEGGPIDSQTVFTVYCFVQIAQFRLARKDFFSEVISKVPKIYMISTRDARIKTRNFFPRTQKNPKNPTSPVPPPGALPHLKSQTVMLSGAKQKPAARASLANQTLPQRRYRPFSTGSPAFFRDDYLVKHLRYTLVFSPCCPARTHAG